MTFNVSVPNASQSPSVFPPQASTNWTRIRDNFNVDHNFLNTFANNQGMHKQVNFLAKTSSSVPLPIDSNGILFGYADPNVIDPGTQLYWYNGNATYRITPGVQLVVGSGSIAAGGSLGILSYPGYPYVYTGYVGELNTATTSLLQVSGAQYSNGQTLASPGGPIFSVNLPGVAPKTLTVNNLDNTNPHTAMWCIQLMRIPA